MAGSGSISWRIHSATSRRCRREPRQPWARIREAQAELRSAVDSSRLAAGRGPAVWPAVAGQPDQGAGQHHQSGRPVVLGPGDPAGASGSPTTSCAITGRSCSTTSPRRTPTGARRSTPGWASASTTPGRNGRIAPSWPRDRCVLSLKEQARRLLRSQGIPEDQIPFPLRPRPRPVELRRARCDAEIARQQAAGARDQRAMELHNLTGYQDKPINVARAILYSLMPPGSVIKVPDSLWGSALYAALLTGSAFRGARVLFVTPSLRSAPSSGWPADGPHARSLRPADRAAAGVRARIPGNRRDAQDRHLQPVDQRR